MPPQPEIRVGQIWLDNDPRCVGRELVVKEFDERYVYLQERFMHGESRTRIMRKFFRPAGRVYRSGFSLKEK